MAAPDYELVAGDVRLRIEGLRQLVRALDNAGSDAQDMKDLMHEIGMIVVRGAQPPVLTGRLRDSMRAGKGKTKAVVRAGSEGSRLPYGAVVHYGNPHRDLPANPFLTESLVRNRRAVFEKLDNGILQILKKNNLI